MRITLGGVGCALYYNYVDPGSGLRCGYLGDVKHHPHDLLKVHGDRRLVGEPGDPGVSTSVIVIGDLCIDHNQTDERALTPSWGSPALFIAWWLLKSHSHDVLVSGPYGSDLAPLIAAFPRELEAEGQRSLSYRNVTEMASKSGSHTVTQTRTQYWRKSDRTLQPIRPRETWQNVDLLYFCPIVPDADRAEDLKALSQVRQSHRATFVLLAQGLMRQSGAETDDNYREVLVREIDHEEAATWSCFDIVVFSEEDHPNAVATATLWSAHPTASNTGYVVTQGERGATLCHRGESTHFPAERVVRNLDPVGAGDAFSAALGAEFHRASTAERIGRLLALRRAVVEANRAASEFVEQARRTPAQAQPGTGHVRAAATGGDYSGEHVDEGVRNG